LKKYLLKNYSVCVIGVGLCASVGVLWIGRFVKGTALLWGFLEDEGEVVGTKLQVGVVVTVTIGKW